MLHPGQREPTEREKRSNAVPYERRWTGAAYPQPFGMPYYAVGLFLPRSVSDFLWERDEEPYPAIWELYESAKRDMGAL